MIDNMSQQQRMILAVVLSIMFFVVFDKFMAPKQSLVDTNSSNMVKQEIKNSKSAEATAPTSSSSTNVQKAPTLKTDVITTILSKNFAVKIDSLGRIASFVLLGDKFKTSDGKQTTLIGEEMELKPLEIRFSDASLNSEAFKTPYTADTGKVTLDSPKTITLTQKLSTNTVTKKITFNPNGTYKVEVSLEKPAEFYISNGEHPKAEKDQFVFKGVIVEKNDDTLEMIEEGDSEGTLKVMDAKFLASSDKYYTTMFYDFDKGLDVVVSTEHEDPKPFVKVQKNSISINGYIGPKDHKLFESIDPRLTNVIEYGWFTFIAKPMFKFLSYIYSVVGNWGWTIVIATILIKLFLFPLTLKGMISMNKMKELSPKVKEIQAKYKGEPQKMNAKMMELYKKHGANPLGGCFPMILQIPVFFAIYRVLLNSYELKDSAWILWYNDLSAMDPYFVLPLLMGATMFWQQHITPQTITDPMQAKLMKFLPVIFTFFFITFPAGLTLYWFVNNLFTVAQQYYVNALFEKQKRAKEQ